MKEALTIITVLSVVLFIIISIVRIIATIILQFTIKKYLKLLSLLRPKDKVDNNYIPSSRNDILYRDKDVEKQKEQEVKKQQLQNVKRLPKINEDNIDLEPNYNKKEIVGIVKPIGYWTSLIMGQRVVGLMQHAEKLKEQNDNGYWVNMLYSRGELRGKNKGQGRGL